MPSQNLKFTGGWQTFDVPDKVQWLTVDVSGAGSGTTRGGTVRGKIPVTGHTTLYILVGEQGATKGGATIGGGGAGGSGPQGNGWSGGGATVIRKHSRTGSVQVVAGGAGGSSGDDGRGGKGGGDVGEAGALGDLDASGAVSVATGGTQIQGGEGGVSGYDFGLNGTTAADGLLSTGGKGGTSSQPGAYGGGGGGGGYRGGGGGSAGYTGVQKGGGGAGGSNYDVPVVGSQSAQGGGSANNGSCTITWVTPAPANQPPTPPTQVKVGGTDYTESMPTYTRNRLRISAIVNDPNSDDKQLRMVVYYSPDQTFRQYKVIHSDQAKRTTRAEVQLESLSGNTLYYARLYTKDPSGLLSTSYTSLRFWTDRPPGPPTLTSPAENQVITELDPVIYGWTPVDPDYASGTPPQEAFNLQWRRAGSALYPAGDWTEVTFTTPDNTYVGTRTDYKSNTYYEWRVRTRDEQNEWGEFSLVRSFFVSGSSTPPQPLSPVRNQAVDAADPLVFTYRFRDPTAGRAQVTADLRYRLVGTTDWVTFLGDTTTPGPMDSIAFDPGTLQPGHYEWEPRTHSDAPAISDWSDPEQFWVVATDTTDELVVPDVLVSTSERLGSHHNRVWVYRRGGTMRVGELTSISQLQYTRKRDDIGNCTIALNDPTGYEKQLLADVHAWTHEIVIFRDGERTWEGPITLPTDSPDSFSIEAKDVMMYLARRIMRQGYNDAYRVVNGVPMGLETVVQRSRQIIMNALAPDDPNVLQYLTSLDFPDDAREGQTVPDFGKSAWEDVDSLAATAGLDYSVLGRRIILYGTHRPLGRLPELRSEHFSSPPIISEYGMLLATDYAVTDNNGVWALASKRTPGEVGPYGIVELLVSSFGQTESTAAPTALTPEDLANLERTLQAQADLGIASRYPTPLVVRVPDNSTLMPDTPVKLSWLVPGVWIPLRAKGTVHTVAQWQKLDSVTVTEDASGEKVSVVMSPAPNAGEDPDSSDPGTDA